MGCKYLEIDAVGLKLLKESKCIPQLNFNESQESGKYIINVGLGYCSCGLFINDKLNDIGVKVVEVLEGKKCYYEII
jgi:hypothetical protein